MKQFSEGLKNRDIGLVEAPGHRNKFVFHLFDFEDALKHNPVRIEGKWAKLCRNLIEKDVNGQLAATFATKSKSME